MKPSLAGVLAALTVAAGAGVLYGPAPLAVAGGLLLALALPGFAVTEMMLRGRTLARVERVVLGPALSLAVLVLAGLVIYVLRFRLDRMAWTSATVGVTLVSLIVPTIPRNWRAAAGRALAYLYAEDDVEPGTAVLGEPAATTRPGPTPALPPAMATAGTDDTLVLPAVVLAEQAQVPVSNAAQVPVPNAAQVPVPNAAHVPVPNAAHVPVPKAAQVAVPKAARAPAAGPAKPPRRLVWQAAPLLLVLAILGGASWLSYDSSRSAYDTTVTALSAEPSGPMNAAGKRSVTVTVTGLVTADGPYSLAASGARGSATVRRTIKVPAGGVWTESLTLPGSQRITVTLSRAGDTSAYRTLYISAVE
ncbi:MAG: hypothetical protein QOC94_3665 [Actinoplanes sp.]|nr:hypothetical protein [Actinoplanes sp.]